MIITFFMVVMIMVFVSCNKVQTSDTKMQDTAFSMGTSFTTTLYGSDSKVLESDLEAVRVALETMDQDISWRNEGSLVSIFNQEHKVSVGKYEHVFEVALDVAKNSQGAFDPTVLSVSELWGIGTENQ